MGATYTDRSKLLLQTPLGTSSVVFLASPRKVLCGLEISAVLMVREVRVAYAGDRVG